MRKAADTLRMGAVLLGALGLGPLVGGGTSYASDLDDVKAAVDANHAAIASLDIGKIDAVWAHDGTVIDKEPPDKTITVGWEGTRKKFREPDRCGCGNIDCASRGAAYPSPRRSRLVCGHGESRW